MEDRPLGGPEIRRLVREVAESLGPHGDQHAVILVGGSLLAWHGLRDTTVDVDSVSRLDDDLRAAVSSVGQANGLSSDWLNADAAAFAPATFERAACPVLLDLPRLLVLGAPMKDVFLMKMYRCLPNDIDDMVKLWPHSGFSSAGQVVDAFFAAYPQAPDDEHLDQLVVEIARRAGDEIA